jgi:preprotein translocase subunit SecB
MSDKPVQKFAVQRVYIKDLSFESPQSPAVFSKQWKPQIKVDLNTRSGNLENSLVEVVLTITITATQDDETGFLVEVQQAGQFLIEGLNEEQMQQVLGIACPNMLFPYARETVDSLVVRGGFPAINLQPVNFEALFLQAKKQAASEAETATTH